MSQVDAILTAAIEGDADEVRRLVSEDPSLLSVTGSLHKTPLHLAAQYDHPEVARVLLDAGASLTAETTRRMTPLEVAAHHGSSRAARALLAAGARLDLWAAAGLGMLAEVRLFWIGPQTLSPEAARPEYHQQADGSWASDTSPEEDYRRLVSDSLYVACRNGHAEVARFLLDQGAEIDHRGLLGGTALHWAASGGHGQTVELLLARGARTDLLDEAHKDTARGWAERNHHPEVAALLPE